MGILKKFVGVEMTEDIFKKVDNIVIQEVGNYIDKKIHYLCDYMKVINISQSGSSEAEQDKSDTYDVLRETLIDGDWRYLNGEDNE